MSAMRRGRKVGAAPRGRSSIADEQKKLMKKAAAYERNAYNSLMATFGDDSSDSEEFEEESSEGEGESSHSDEEVERPDSNDAEDQITDDDGEIDDDDGDDDSASDGNSRGVSEVEEEEEVELGEDDDEFVLDDDGNIVLDEDGGETSAKQMRDQYGEEDHEGSDSGDSNDEDNEDGDIWRRIYVDQSEAQLNRRELDSAYTSSRWTAFDHDTSTLGSSVQFRSGWRTSSVADTADYEELSVKKRLLDAFRTTSSVSPESAAYELDLFRLLSSYSDVLATNVPRDFWTNDDDESQSHLFHPDRALPHERAVLLHSLNHVLKTTDRVMKNQARLKEAALKAAADRDDVYVRQKGGKKRRLAGNVKVNDLVDEDSVVRDMSFTRPRVLFIVPMRNAAYRLVMELLSLIPVKEVMHKKRFVEEFGPSMDDDRALLSQKKPFDFQRVFRGNTDDCFRMGIKLTRRSVRLYSDFFQSDIIIASPLGLQFLMAEKSTDDAIDPYTARMDFLSSIEVACVLQAETISMQNWQHLASSMQCLNRIPKESHGVDISRVQMFYLDGLAKFFRQLLVFSSSDFAELHALYNQHARHQCGQLRIRSPTTGDGQVGKVLLSMRQAFQRVPKVKAVSEVSDVRFRFFVKSILPQIVKKASMTKHYAIFVPSYFDYVRLRNHFIDQNYDFTELCEYTSTPNISRNRSNFYHSRRSILLVTERFHYFNRYRLRGIQNLCFYALPQSAGFYGELVNMMDVNDSSVVALYTKYDRWQLEQCVGAKRMQKMLLDDRDTYMFT